MKVITECVSCHLVLREETNVGEYFLSIPYAPYFREHQNHRIQLRVESEKIGHIQPSEKALILEGFLAWLYEAYPGVEICDMTKASREEWSAVDDLKLVNEYREYLQKGTGGNIGHSKNSTTDSGDEPGESGGSD